MWRLLWRGDRRGRTGTLLTVVGVAVAVFCALLVTAVPRALEAADSRLVARTPVGQPGTHGMRITSSIELFEGRAWTRMYVAGPGVADPRPPGLDAWPAAGQTLLSPELARTLAGRSDAGRLTGPLAPGVVGDAGLTAPGELLSYEVYAGPAGSDIVVTGFGDPRARGSILSVPLVVQLVVVVALPLVLFLLVVMRLSLRWRAQRSAALHLIGVGPRRGARLFAVEMGVVSAIGATSGVVAYAAFQPVIAGSGVLGLAWFPADAQLPWWAAILVVVVFTCLATRLAHLVMSGGVSDAWRDASPRRWRTAVGLTLFVPAATVAIACVAWAAASDVEPRVLPEGGYIPTVLACLLVGALGLALLLPGAIAGVAGWVARLPCSPGTRLGARLAGAHAVAMSPMAAAMALIVLLAGASEAVLKGMYVDGVGDLSRVSVQVDLNELAPETRLALLDLPAHARVVYVIGDSASPSIGPGLPMTVENGPWITVATCPDVQAHMVGMPGIEGCTGRPQQFAMDYDTTIQPAGTPIIVRLHDGTRVTVPTPAERYEAPGNGVLLPPQDAPWVAHASSAFVVFQTSALDGSYENLVAGIHAVAPRSLPHTAYASPEALTQHLQYSAVFRAGIGMAAILTALAAALIMLDLRWRTRGTRAAQQALGIPRRALRHTALSQVGVPTMTALALAVPFTLGVSWFYTGYWGPSYLLSGTVGRAVALTAVLAAVTAAGGAMVLTHGKFTVDDLAEE
ncbi:hypothetical protein KILIM_005_01580 [Kineosphaera limosa NBRC 100340]|uniref:ABC3 transporter permease protein domain-containing protein n=1 Tax=Kineosphaera limosa NBRC 100340 TaxID=1184609 RepID=K6WL55_9MICO|nr:hypothetical protein KILIM_005_01580 [Kineosphaera limosa NBRC 100340]